MAVKESSASTLGRSGLRCETVAAALALTAVAVLSAIVLTDPGLASRLTAENGAVEWLQVFLDAAAALLVGRRLVRSAAAGSLSPLDLLWVSALIGLVIGEVDLDRRLFGIKIIATRFFVDGAVALPWRVLAVLVVVGVPAAVGGYALVRAQVLCREAWAALAEPWGRVLAVSAAVVACTEVFERQLGLVPHVPRYFLEELFEVVGSIGFFVAAAARR